MPTKMDMDALNCASESTVRAILFALCADRSVRFNALKMLDQLQPSAKLMARAPEYTQLRTKRKADVDLAICVQCDEPFSEQNNTPQACTYHSGELEVDNSSDFWVDWWEQTHGPIDCPDNKEEYPEGFMWTCCERNGLEKGCKLGRHQSNPDLSKKGRFASSSSPSVAETEGDVEEEEEDDDDDQEEEGEDEEEESE